MLAQVVAYVCLFWYIAIAVVGTVGYVQIFRHYQSKLSKARVESFPDHEIPRITIIRPVRGLEPYLYECLASTFQQSYPAAKLTIYFCVATDQDPAYPILCKLANDYKGFDVAILIETEDPGIAQQDLGPNPKIRNMSRAYREAKSDLVWIVDCNVWVDHGAAGHMVDKLCGYVDGKIYKFVHQLPLGLDVTGQETNRTHASSSSLVDSNEVRSSSFMFGGRLDELFLASAHAKFYTAINTVLIAPCIVGKSNMFRKSHLDDLTSHDNSRPSGIDYFSYNICEDHLIGDLLWKQKVPEERGILPQKLGKHAMVFGDLAIQPVARMSVGDYIARRVRWLRVRKFTVTLATFVEPGTESLLCSLYGSFAVTSIPWFKEVLNIPSTWTSFVLFWILSVTIWAAVDWTLYQILHSMATIERDQTTPWFARGPEQGSRRSFTEWLKAWIGRELLALPIWTWAFYGGVTVTWRGQRFRVGTDMRVQALDTVSSVDRSVNVTSQIASTRKARRE